MNAAVEAKETAQAPLPRLSIAATLRGAFAVFGRFRTFAKIAALPFALILALSFFADEAYFRAMILPGMFPVVAMLGFILLPLFPFAVLGISLNRAMLIDPEAARAKPLDRRTWIAFGYGAAILAIFWVTALAVIHGSSAAVKSLAILVSGSTAAYVLGLIEVAFIAVILLYVFARLSLLFPAIAVDESQGPAGSWRLTRGSGLKLTAVFLAITLLLVPVVVAGAKLVEATDAVTDAVIVWLQINVIPVEHHRWSGDLLCSLPAPVLVSLIACFAAALPAGAAASAYAQLSGRSGSRDEILERFE